MAEALTPSTPAPEPMRQSAIGPLNVVDMADIKLCAGEFDAWLRSVSDGYITLDRVIMVASAVPVLGNVIALVDVIGDVVGMASTLQAGQEIAAFDWVNLGINLIGLIPAPGSAAARTALRPALKLTKNRIVKALEAQGKSAAKNMSHIGMADIGEALLQELMELVNDQLAGTLEKFVDGAEARIQAILADCATLVESLLDDILKALKTFTGEIPYVKKPRPRREPNLRDLKQTGWDALLTNAWVLYREVNLQAASEVGKVASDVGDTGIEAAIKHMPDVAKVPVQEAIKVLQRIRPMVRAKLMGLAQADADLGIKFLLQKIKQALLDRKPPKGKTSYKSATVPAEQGGNAKDEQTGGGKDGTHKQAAATGDPGCKSCPAPKGTAKSISLKTAVTHPTKPPEDRWVGGFAR